MKCIKSSLPSSVVRWAVAAFVAVGTTVGTFAALQTIDIDFSINDIKGRPSTVVARQTAKQRVALNKATDRRRVTYRQSRDRAVGARREQVKGKPVLVVKRTTTIPAPKPPKGQRLKPPTRVVVEERTVQNLRVRVADEKGTPLRNFTLVAAVQGPQSESRPVTLVTGNDGTASVKGIPLPAAVSLEITGEAANQYRFARPDAGSVAILQPTGVRTVAQNMEEPILWATIGVPQAAPRVTVRTITYQGDWPEEIRLVKTTADVEITAPPETQLAVAGRSEPVVVGPDGRVTVTLGENEYADGVGLPIRFTRNLAGGPAEAVVKGYRVDPYAVSRIEAPEMRLVALTGLDLNPKADVLQTVDQLAKEFGDARRERNAARAKVTNHPDGSSTWSYPPQGLEFVTRVTTERQGRNDVSVVEAVRILNREAGSVGGLRVGDSMEDATVRLGVADPGGRPEPGEPSPGSVSTWLDGGLRIGYFAGRIKWIAIARPRELLESGTTAYVPRSPARVFFEEYQPPLGAPLVQSKAEMAEILETSNAVVLVDDKEDADLILRIRMDRFQETQSQVLDNLPLAYSATMGMRYDILDAETGRFLVENQPTQARASADYKTEAGLGAAVGLIGVFGNTSDFVKALSAVGVAIGVDSLQRTLKRAKERCPKFALQGALQPMMQGLAKAADFSVRVTSIDYAAGTVTINAGSANGVRKHSDDRPSEFEVAVRGRMLPSTFGGLRAEYWALRPITVYEDSAVCEFVRINRRVDKVQERNEAKADLTMLRKVIRPSTGVVTGIAMFRFAEID